MTKKLVIKAVGKKGTLYPGDLLISRSRQGNIREGVYVGVYVPDDQSNGSNYNVFINTEGMTRIMGLEKINSGYVHFYILGDGVFRNLVADETEITRNFFEIPKNIIDAILYDLMDGKMVDESLSITLW